jgi:hypothetical protein
MYVDHPAQPVVDEVVAEDAHEAGKADDVDMPAFERLGHDIFEHVAAGELALRQGSRGDAVAGRNGQAGRGGAVGEHADDLCGIVGRLGGLDQRLHVRAAAGDEDCDALFGLAQGWSPPGLS